MNLSAVGCSFRTAPVEVRERLASDEPRLERALAELSARYGCEAVLLGTCNRVELYLARGDDAPAFDAELVAEFLGECQQVPTASVLPHLYERRGPEAVRHLFRVASSLDSLVVGEAQIAGQVKRAFEFALSQGTTGSLLNALFLHAIRTSKRVRTETGIARGHVSVSSVAVDYVREVFDRFDDKTVLVVGAGKMGRLTLKHLRGLGPRRIRVTNRSPEKAQALAAACGGEAVPWEKLDDALAAADIVLSTTGSAEPVVTKERYRGVLARRGGGAQVILDIAVPRDFDPEIHDGDRTCLFNIDDLTRIREQTLAARQRHVAPAEAIVEQEARKFVEDWSRRRNGPVIARLTQEFDAKRRAVLEQLFSRLDGKLSEADRAY
ncbi:MAG TPA: glutamyl-tRNA reductase, partial [Gemmataceae bacterium]